MEKVGPVQDPEQAPRLQNLTLPVCSSSLQPAPENQRLSPRKWSFLDATKAEDAPPPCFWIKETKKQSGREH